VNPLLDVMKHVIIYTFLKMRKKSLRMRRTIKFIIASRFLTGCLHFILFLKQLNKIFHFKNIFQKWQSQSLPLCINHFPTMRSQTIHVARE